MERKWNGGIIVDSLVFLSRCTWRYLFSFLFLFFSFVPFFFFFFLFFFLASFVTQTETIWELYLGVYFSSPFVADQ